MGARAARGVAIQNLEVELEGHVDLNGSLQLAPTRAGFSGIKSTVRVKSDADDGVLDELGRLTQRASPVYDSLSAGVPIQSSVVRIG